MYFLAQVKLGLMVFSFVNSQGLYDDPCNLFDDPSRYFDQNGVMYLTVPPTCTSGSVFWNYPQGFMVLNATHTSITNALCIIGSQGTEFGGLFDITEGVEKPLEIPTEANGVVCVNNVRGDAAIKVKAPSHLRYLTIFKYWIQYPLP